VCVEAQWSEIGVNVFKLIFMFKSLLFKTNK